MSLKSKLNKIAKKLLISDRQQALLKSYSEKIEEFHYPTYEHSIRVALKSAEVAKVMEMGINASRALYYGGLLHDLGKINIDKRILQKKDFDAYDMDEIKSHTLDGYLMLKNDFPFSALVCLLHHSYQKDGYPKIKSLESKINMSKVHRYARIISLIDCYDATNRNNNRYGKKLNRKEIMQKMHDTYREVMMSKMINLYYMMKIFK